MTTPSPAALLRIVLADDHDLVRSGIKSLLGLVPGVEVVAEARDGLELLKLVDALLPDLVLTDISMPPGMDGIEAISQIHLKHPEVRLLVVSMFDSVDFIRRAMASGASGYLMKDASPFELGQAIRTVMATGSYFSTGISKRLLQPSPPTMGELLTDRQVEILKLIASGQASKEIAHGLGLSPKTVDVHRARIMERLAIGDVAGLTRYAVRNGLVAP